MRTFIYPANTEKPDYVVEWKDRDGNTIDFSSGYTFTVKLVAQDGTTVALTKTSGITGAATMPNVTVLWASGQLNITPGTYRLHLTATTGSSDRPYQPGAEDTVVILAAV